MQKILIANRGEIAVRVIRACREMGLASVAVYSECDRGARHVRMADEAVAIGASPPAESYLHIDRIIEAARTSRADAIHPGYGFLAENAAFADACGRAGLTFIGPSVDAIRLMGSKTSARRAAKDAGVPVVPGTEEPLGAEVPDLTVATIARDVGYPLLVKAVAGGGGKGMRVVDHPGDLSSAIRAARSEAASAFGNPAIYLERRLMRPRHIEVQLLADHHGTVIPFVERECSIQRRHQKLIEESPSPAVSPELRDRLLGAAVAIAKTVGYTNAGTIEFLVERDRFYFLEMNTRLQVEHAVTEMVTGIDLVRWQIAVAAGRRLDLTPDDVRTRGHAIECRIYAEDPEAGFLPSPGRITDVRVPNGPGTRDDNAVEPGTDIPIFYDSLISKLAVWDIDRPSAVRRIARALREYEVTGVRTTIPFFQWMVRQDSFLNGDFHTGALDELLHTRRNDPFLQPDPSFEEVAAVAAALHTGTRLLSDVRSTLGSWGGDGAVEDVRRVSTRTSDSDARRVEGHRPGESSWRQRARLEGLRR